jgi:tetratricopeptide (TPR) repeat protein
MRRRSWVFLLVFLVLGSLLRPEREVYVSLIREGDAHAALKEYSFAARVYRQAATLRPGSPTPFLRLGQTFLAQAWYDRAQAALLGAYRNGGWTPELGLRMGQVYQGMGLEAEAIGQWESALAEDPHLAEARLEMGWAYLRRGAWHDAIVAFEAILSRWDDAHRRCWQSAHYGLGLLLSPKDPKGALHHLQIAAGGADPELADKAIVLGAGLQRSVSSTDATHALALLGQACVRVGAWSLARLTLVQAVAAEPSYAEARAYLGHALDYLGEAVEAERQLLQAVRLTPTETLPRYLLGLYYQRHGQPREAVFQFRQALKLAPYDASLYAELGQTWLDEGKYGDAEIAFRAAAELATEQVGFQLLLARFYVDRLIKVRTHGLPSVRRAVDLDPANACAFDLLGWAYYLSGFLDEAESALRRAVTLDPELASARYHLGAVLLSRARSVEASEQLWRAVDLDRTGYYRSQAMQALGLPVE